MQNPNVGMWPSALLMIVLASWVVYRYLAPKRWREWTRAGLVQAFIIALYAEMYGFPLTIYILITYFDIDIPWRHESGALWPALLGYGGGGHMVVMLLAYVIIFIGVLLVIHGWREVYYARQQQRLATDGVYAIVRHPQYAGILMAMFGELIHWPTLITLALFPIIVFAYFRLARKEEREMLDLFGDEYREYQRRVPMVIPRLGEVGRLFRTTP